MKRCDWCYREVEDTKLKEIQIIGWEDLKSKGIRNVCLRCRMGLRFMYRLKRNMK